MNSSHKNNCRVKWNCALLSYSARAIFSGSCFCGDFSHELDGLTNISTDQVYTSTFAYNTGSSDLIRS